MPVVQDGAITSDFSEACLTGLTWNEEPSTIFVHDRSMVENAKKEAVKKGGDHDFDQAPAIARKQKRKSKKKGKTLQEQGELTGVKYGGGGMAGRSTVVMGVRNTKTVSGIKYDQKTHKRITKTISTKEADPLDPEFESMSLDELRTATKELVLEMKRQKKEGASAEDLVASKEKLKQMKRAQDSKQSEVVTAKVDLNVIEA